jgi:hypothetical protein
MVMAAMLLRLANIFFGIGVEGFLAARGTEVICLAFVLGLAGGSRGIDVHTTNGVFKHRFHLLSISIGNLPTNLPEILFVDHPCAD